MKTYYIYALIVVTALVLYASSYYALPKKKFAHLNLETVRYYYNPLKKFSIITADREIVMRGHDMALLDARNPGRGGTSASIDASGPVYYEIVLDDNSVKKGVVLENLKRGD